MVLARLATLLLTAVLLPACAATAPAVPVSRTAQGSTATITADWADLEAAVITGAAQAEMAPVGTTVTDHTYTVSINTIGGDSGTFTALREDPKARGPQPIRLLVQIGRFEDPGNHAAEDRLIRTVSARLRALAGKAIAPIKLYEK